MLLMVIDIKKIDDKTLTQIKQSLWRGNYHCKFHLTVNFYIFVLTLMYAPVAQ